VKDLYPSRKPADTSLKRRAGDPGFKSPRARHFLGANTLYFGSAKAISRGSVASESCWQVLDV